jgi:NAD(P)H-flavin reductase/ferredoxin
MSGDDVVRLRQTQVCQQMTSRVGACVSTVERTRCPLTQPNAPKRLPTIQLNETTTIVAEPGETVLQAALRNGVAFPNSCRVGGCGTCKCRLADGAVKEHTETGYLLTGDELDQGYILACQSVPTTDVRIEVPLAPVAAGITGMIIEQEKLTHDITRLSVELEKPLAFEPGQFANITVEGLAGVTRSYSFAAPPSDDRTVEFFIRKVPGGKLSSYVNDQPVLGQSVRVDGPHGEFVLRPADAPLLFIAGGSGLAPILAILRAQARAHSARSVTLLFGARTVKDLYALDEIAALAKEWKGAFRFVPVLSEAQSDASWTGARGLVTEHLADSIEPGAHAYLCGPPAMIDAAALSLREHGVPRQHIRADRFTTLADTAPKEQAIPPTQSESSSQSPIVSALHYLKFFSFHLVGLLALVVLVLGGSTITAGLLSVLALYMVGDALLGDDTSTPTFRYPAILTAQLWLALPLLAAIVFTSVWSVSSADALGYGAWIHSWTGYDALAARAATSAGHHVSAWILTGLMIGMLGTITAHELTHRTWDKVSMFFGRWLLAFSFDTSFAIEHVYGHHRYVSTVEDPATAPRGRNVYFHVLASTIKGNVSAWKIEAARLKKRRLPALSPHNVFIRGHLMSALLVALAWAVGGATGAGYFIACALWGKSLLEIVNYMEHYGMVRDPATPVQPRHSWNTNRRVSSWTMFNLTRHSHHHAQGEVPYQDLRPYPDAPMMINGYLTTILVAMIPPLWHKLMTPKVLAWDRDYATEHERSLAARANATSGIDALAQR